MTLHKDIKIGVIAAALIVVLLIVVFLLTGTHTMVVVPKYYFTLVPGQAAVYNLTVPQGYNATLNGEFISNNNLKVAVLNDAQMTAFTNFRIATNFNKTYNNLTSAVSYTFNATDNSKLVIVDTINAKLSQGRYYILFYNLNPEYLIKPQNMRYWANVSMATPIVLTYMH